MSLMSLMVVAPLKKPILMNLLKYERTFIGWKVQYVHVTGNSEENPLERIHVITPNQLK